MYCATGWRIITTGPLLAQLYICVGSDMKSTVKFPGPLCYWKQWDYPACTALRVSEFVYFNCVQLGSMLCCKIFEISGITGFHCYKNIYTYCCFWKRLMAQKPWWSAKWSGGSVNGSRRKCRNPSDCECTRSRHSLVSLQLENQLRTLCGNPDFSFCRMLTTKESTGFTG